MSTAIESLLDEGYQARRERRYDDAKNAFSKAAEIAREAKDPATMAKSLARLGGIERDLNELDVAISLYQRAYLLYRDLDEPLPLCEAHILRHIADIAFELGRFEISACSYYGALTTYRDQPDTTTLDLANSLRGYALLNAAKDQREDAIAAWREAGSLYQQVWQEPDSPYSEADLAPAIAECRRQIAQLSDLK